MPPRMLGRLNGFAAARAMAILSARVNGIGGAELVNGNNIVYLVTTWALPVIIAVTFHEVAHGYVAYLLGDSTAWRQGRVNFNPLKHIDPVGTVLLPTILLIMHSPFLFGYAKPVPVNFR